MTMEELLTNMTDELLLIGATGHITVSVSRAERPDGSSWYTWWAHFGSSECVQSNCWSGIVDKVKASVAEKRAREPVHDLETREALLSL